MSGDRPNLLLEDTVVCLVSDQGDLMGDHNLYRKALPYEGSARIAFAPAGQGRPAGAVHDAVAELRDVLPTLIDCVGRRGAAVRRRAPTRTSCTTSASGRRGSSPEPARDRPPGRGGPAVLSDRLAN